MSRTPLLDSLIAGGYLKAWLDYRSGHGNCMCISSLGSTFSGTPVFTRNRIDVTQANSHITSSANLNFASTELSIITSMTMTKGFAANYTFSDWRNNGGGNYGAQQYTNTTGKILSAIINATTNKSKTSSKTLITGTKYCIGLSYKDNDANGLQQFFDGVADAGAAVSTVGFTSLWPNRAFELFWNQLGGTEANSAKGYCDYYLVFSKSFTAAEHLQIKNELDSIKYNLRPGGRWYNAGVLLYDYKGDWGILQSVATEGGVAGQWISNTGFQTFDTTGRFQVVRETAGPNGILGKSIKATAATARKISKRDIPNSSGTWTYYWWDNSAAAWKTQTSAITSGTTQTDFELDTNDRLFIAADNPSYTDYSLKHTP